MTNFDLKIRKLKNKKNASKKYTFDFDICGSTNIYYIGIQILCCYNSSTKFSLNPNTFLAL